MAWIFCAATVAAGQAACSDMVEKVKPVIPIKAQPFSLRDVRLLDGPFKHAQELDRRYLLSLDPERLLHNFRVNAGLPSSARPLGGWEAPDCELRGHFVGHYLSACARMYASTGDAKLKKNAEYVVAELAKCQQALGSGYLSAFPETFLDRVEARQRVWAPWYTLHKILAGLLDVYLYCGDKQALEVAERFAQWAKRRTDRLSDEQMQAMLGTEHGGMNEALANLYALTGKQDYLALAQRFNHHAVLDPLARGEDHLTGLHANTQIPKVIGAAREYELTGDPAMHAIADFFWNVVTKERSYVIGGHSDGESFSPKEHLSQYLSAHTTETCNTYNMLKLTRHLFLWDPKAEYADYYERALYNHILASQNPKDGMMCYYVPLRSGSHKVFSTPDDSFWCCTGTGVENHAQYGDSLYFHDDTSLYVNLFIASELTWKEKGVLLRQETRFPEEETTRLVFTCEKPVEMALRIRHPFWAGSGFRVRVNGTPEAVESAPGSYAVIARHWRSGDTVEVSLPMSLRTEAFRDNPHRLAFLYGPIVLCGEVDAKRPAPAIVSDNGRILADLKPEAGTPLRFTGSPRLFHVPGASEGQPMLLGPFYRMADKSYAVYFDVLTPEQWQEKRKEYEAEQARLREIAARRVDSVEPGEPESEREHKFAGETTYAGDFGDRHWRDARLGGWFAYELKVLPDTPQELVCTYWGSDAGREFDVLVDGMKIAMVRLTNAHPGHFYDEIYPLPPDLLRGKETITVRFQGHPGRSAGGVFGCMILRQRSTAAPPPAISGTAR
ncbi:MAG TPA: beta-L-arabinofuranosidase domain-containing protein [Chthonomonadaceae bacterium]|nr:beta-L-arabinofuranosidase domain-containing protein [Chthonomonadaceae bacterium]